MGKRDTDRLCKIWIEPEVTLAVQGDLTNTQVREVMQIVGENREKLMKQWTSFKEGKAIRIIKIKR